MPWPLPHDACAHSSHCGVCTGCATGSEHLRTFNLSENGRKFPWEALRCKMRRLTKDTEGARIVVHTGDGVTEVLEGAPVGGGGSESDEEGDDSGGEGDW